MNVHLTLSTPEWPEPHIATVRGATLVYFRASDALYVETPKVAHRFDNRIVLDWEVLP